MSEPWEDYAAKPWEDFVSSKATATAEPPKPALPPIQLSPYEKARLGGMEPVAGPFGPANPREVLALPDILKAPAAVVQKSGVMDALEQIGADFLNRTGINPSAQPGVPLVTDKEPTASSTPPSPLEEAFPNVTRGVRQTLAGFTTPGSFLLAPAAGLKPVQAAFSAQMATGIPDSIQALSEARTSEDIAKAGTALITQVLATVHGLKGKPSPVDEAISRTAPKTAEALQETASTSAVEPTPSQAVPVELPSELQDIRDEMSSGRTARAQTLLNLEKYKLSESRPDIEDEKKGLADAVLEGRKGREEFYRKRIQELQQEHTQSTAARKAQLDQLQQEIDQSQPEKGAANAIQPESPQVLRTVQNEPVESPGQVPTQEGGGEVSARGGEETGAQDVAKDRARYDELVNQMKTKPDMAAWQEMETIKNRYAGKPPPAPEAAPAAVKPTDLRPAIRTEQGVVHGEYGDSHTDVLEANGLDKDKVDHFSPDRGFVDVNNPTKFLTRKEAEAMSGLAGKAEAGGLDSQDLPGAAMAKLERMLGEPVSAKEPEPQLQGMGGAVAGEFPEPRQAAIAGGQVEDVPPNGRPMGVISNFGSGIRNAINEVRLFMRGAAGDTLPRTTAAHRETGEAGARYLSSRIAAMPNADMFYARALQDTGVDPLKFGAALTEDNLQSIRESQHIEAEKARAEGREEDALTADAKAQNVASIIGSKGSPFQTYDEFLDYLEDPMVKKAIAQHIQLWQEVIEPMYKEARNIDPNVELPSRGLNTGARINLKAVLPDEEEPVGKAVQGSSGLTGTFKRRTPFSFKAKGTGATYDTSYQNIIRNTFAKQLELANKNVFDKALVDSGNAVIDVPGRTVHLPDGSPTTSFPLSRGFGSRNIYVRSSLANEYEAAAGIGRRHRIPILTPLANVLNKAAIAGLTEGTVHVSNQLTALFDRPASGKLLHDTLLSATGRADIPITFTKAVMKAFQDNQSQLAELAEIGALRPEYEHRGIFGVGGRLLAKTDRLTRLMLDDTFKSLVKEGLVTDTETARREYVNQIGQYNRRAQGWLVRTLRDTGLGPFATAGRTLNALGVKMATLSPGTPATSAMAAAALRANVLSKWIGTAVVVGTLNWLLTHKKGGGLMGRPGNKTGDVDLGINNKNGKMLALPLASLIGVGRGLRVTGLKGAIDAKRMGLSDSDAIDAASRDIINSWMGPAAGPPVRFGAIALTGYPAAVKVGRASPVVPPGDSQTKANIQEALREASPIYSTYDKIKKGASWDEIVNTQFPRLSPVPGKTEATVKNYPQIVKAAQANEFIDFVVHETRKQDPDKRLDYATEQIKRLPPEFQKKAWNEMKRRRVFAQ